MSQLLPVVALAAGVGTHLLFFKHSERHLNPYRYLQALLLAVATATVARNLYGHIPLKQSVVTSCVLCGWYLLGLYASVITYRRFLNPLNRFPGPFGARLSKFDHVFKNVKLDGHHQLLRLHQKYGKFVRIGPNDISVIDPEGIEVCCGVKSPCSKAQWYSQDTPLISLHTTRDKGLHDRRRRIWSPAFSDKALRGYETRIQTYNHLLLKQIDAFGGAPINVSKWFNLYSFDVMGDLGFGRSFDMLQSGETHWAIKLLNAGMDPMGLAFPPWFFRLLIAIPGLTAGYHQFIGFCNQQLDNRMKMGKMDNPDITSVLIDHYRKTGSDQKALPMMQGDSRLIIVAGSDTTAATLVHLFYHLARLPESIQRLRQELTPLLQGDNQVSHQKIQDAPYLNGVINETLRLNPPVPSGVFRKTPPEGVDINGTFVPGNTVIQMPTFVMGHDEDVWPSCEDFMPERWYSRQEMMKHKDAFSPFSTGPFGCIGKNLAYMEIRLLTTQLIMKYDVAFAPGEDGKRLLMESTDHFTMGLADLHLVFSKRK